MIKVYIAEHFWADSLKVFITRQFDDGGPRQILHYADGHPRWDVIQPEQDDEPSWILPYDTGRALTDALVRHYQGAEDTRALRRDYDAERKRVDQQSAVIADIARTLAQGKGETS